MNLQILIIIPFFVGCGIARETDLEESLANYNSSLLPGTNICGIPNDLVQQMSTATYYVIVNSYPEESQTIAGEFPWMAALVYGGNGGVECSGSLINNRYVLTAAHCLKGTPDQLVSVWLGMWKQSATSGDMVKKHDIEEKIVHELFIKEMGGYDIGLIKLKEEVIFTDHIIPICLPKPHLPALPLGTNLTVAGWGYTSESGPRSNVLLKVEVPVVPNNKCVDVFNVSLTEKQLCVGGRRGFDSCRGDSGGPLMNYFVNSAFDYQSYIEGIVSFGYGCGRREKPAVYTRVTEYIDWILSKLS